MTQTLKLKGRKFVRIDRNKYGTELNICLNGFQTNGLPIDDDIIDLLEQAIADYRKKVETNEH